MEELSKNTDLMMRHRYTYCNEFSKQCAPYKEEMIKLMRKGKNNQVREIATQLYRSAFGLEDYHDDSVAILP